MTQPRSAGPRRNASRVSLGGWRRAQETDPSHPFWLHARDASGQANAALATELPRFQGFEWHPLTQGQNRARQNSELAAASQG
jgi:hypothetical protein